VGNVSRRQFIVGGAATAVTAGGLGRMVSDAAAAPQPVRGDEGGTILGPRNEPLQLENPDALAPPATDAGSLPNLKFSFDTAHMRISTGGWSRQVTMRELPIATTMAGVNMRLKPGGIRELHWHSAAEWAFMLDGRARITAVDAQGRNFIADVGVGDLWNFPSGIPHSIQGLEDGCEFLLVFDEGDFSEFDTFLITDWFAHTPPAVLAKNFGVPDAAFSRIPANIESERYIFPGKVPGPLRSDSVSSPAGTVPDSFAHRLTAQTPIEAAGGRVRIVDSSNFPAASTIAAALVDVDPGGMRELHWHPNADEWQYYIDGRARMTVFGADGNANTFDYQAGDVGYIPRPMGHYIENIGQTPLRFLEMFRSDYYADVSLEQWMALTPPDLILAHLDVDRQFMAALSKRKPLIVRA
jgi:oxalate decarboxylase